jgi:hypothetical protein
MKKILALSLAMLMFVMPVNALQSVDWIEDVREEEKAQLWAKLQRQIVEIDKQVKIQNQAANKLDKYGHSDDLEANEKYEYKYNLETIKYWERRKNAAITAIRYNELADDKDNLEIEKGYVAEAQRNIELLSDKLNGENSEVSFSSKVSNGFHGAASFVYRHWKVIARIACVCVAAYVVYAYGLKPARPASRKIPISPETEPAPTYREIINKLDSNKDARIYRVETDECYTQAVIGLNGNIELRGELSEFEAIEIMWHREGLEIIDL